MLFTRLIAFLSVVSLLGCTSMQPVDMANGSPADELAAGDVLRVVDRYGLETELTLVEINDDMLRGTLSDSDGVIIELHTRDIASIEVQKPSLWKTALAGTGGLVLLWGIIGVIALSNMDINTSSGN